QPEPVVAAVGGDEGHGVDGIGTKRPDVRAQASCVLPETPQRRIVRTVRRQDLAAELLKIEICESHGFPTFLARLRLVPLSARPERSGPASPAGRAVVPGARP